MSIPRMSELQVAQAEATFKTVYMEVLILRETAVRKEEAEKKLLEEIQKKDGEIALLKEQLHNNE